MEKRNRYKHPPPATCNPHKKWCEEENQNLATWIQSQKNFPVGIFSTDFYRDENKDPLAIEGVKQRSVHAYIKRARKLVEMQLIDLDQNEESDESEYVPEHHFEVNPFFDEPLAIENFQVPDDTDEPTEIELKQAFDYSVIKREQDESFNSDRSEKKLVIDESFNSDKQRDIPQDLWIPNRIIKSVCNETAPGLKRKKSWTNNNHSEKTVPMYCTDDAIDETSEEETSENSTDSIDRELAKELDELIDEGASVSSTLSTSSGPKVKFNVKAGENSPHKKKEKEEKEKQETETEKKKKKKKQDKNYDWKPKK